MKQYRIGLTQTVYEGCTVIIEAETQEMAERIALNKVYEGEVEWRFIDTADSAEVVECEVVSELLPIDPTAG